MGNPHDDQPTPPKWPWYRLHLSTWLVLLAVATVLVMVEVPGSTVTRTGAGVRNLQHGWPFIWLDRIVNTQAKTPEGARLSDSQIGAFFSLWPMRKTLPRAGLDWSGSGGDPESASPPWLGGWSWSLGRGNLAWYPASAAVDLGIVLVICLVVVAVHERWRRGRRKYWQIAVRDLLVLVAVVAGIMAWYRWEVHQSKREKQVAAELGELGCDCHVRWDTPVWLGKLVPRKYLAWTCRVWALRVSSMAGDDVIGARRMADVAALASELESLEEIGVESNSDAELEAIGGLAQLRRVCLFGSFGDEGVRWIAALPRIEDLSLSPSHYGSPRITDNSLEQLSRVKTLRTLGIRFANITDAGLAHLANLPELESLSLYGCPGLTDAAVVHLKRLTGLRKLLLPATGLSGAAKKELRRALPDTEVY